MAPNYSGSQPDSFDRFLQSHDLSELAAPGGVPLPKETDNFKTALCLEGFCIGVISVGFAAVICPIQTCAPTTLEKSFSLSVDESAVYYHGAKNDCCCHVANTAKTVPYDKIQDVEVVESCELTLCGLKRLNVQTAGGGGGEGGGPRAEIEAIFLADTEQARDVIMLAARLKRDGASGSAPAPMPGMQRGASGNELSARLANLTSLTADGTLSEQEATDLRLTVLDAERDPLPHLRELRQLLEANAISRGEYDVLKKQHLARL